MQQKTAFRTNPMMGRNYDLILSLQANRQQWKSSPPKTQLFATIQPSLYSLAAESSKLINEIHLPKPKKTNYQHRERRSESEMLGRSQEAMGLEGVTKERQLPFHRYGRELRQSEVAEGRLLKKIIDRYKIRSLERSYYDNLVSNLGMKITNPIESNNRVKVKGNLKLSRNKNRSTLRHLNSVELDSLFESPIKIEAQTINPSLKDRPAEVALLAPSTKEKMNLTVKGRFSSKKSEASESKVNLLELSENVIVQKVNKYKQFLFLVNWAHQVYRDLDIHTYSQSFNVYIGPGNNRNLIRGIVKQRFWLEETKHKELAQILWTQLKEETVFKKQAKRGKEQQNKEREKKTQKTNTLIEGNNQTVIIYRGKEDLSQNREKGEKPTKPQLRNSEAMDSQSRILTNSQLQASEVLMQRYTYKKKGLFQERVKYLGALKVVGEEQLGQVLIHNHLPLNGLLGNKKAMFHMLKEYYKLTSRNIFDVVPLTYHIKKVGDSNFQTFAEAFTENKGQGKPNIWIVKPGEFSNRGHGIKCVSKLEEVKARASQLGFKKSLIVQEYLTNPLLYNGRKFDIRTYMLISVNNGILRAYWYQEGYIRTSSQPWRLDSLSDSYVHLTNDAVQSHSDDYGKFEPGNKLSYADLERYLEGLPKTSFKEHITFQSHILPALKRVAADAVKATFPFIDPGRHSSNFQIFGFDFMVDSSFKPWLIEINTNPCLELSCPLLRRIIPSMVENAFRLGLDPVFPPPLNYSSTYKYGIPQNALHYNRFQLIFDQERDGPAVRLLYEGSSPMESLEDYEEDKETYEQEGDEIELIEK